MKVFCKCGEFLYSEPDGRNVERRDGLCAGCCRKESIGTKLNAMSEHEPTGEQFTAKSNQYWLITRKMRGG